MENVGSLDRNLRLVIGAVLLMSPFILPFAAFFVGWGAWSYAVAVVGVVLLATAALRTCPIYILLGVRTCDVTKR